MTTLKMSREAWEEARQVLVAGGLVAFPTDTVYGLGCDLRNVDAIERIYQVKGRPAHKALPLLLAGAEHLRTIVDFVPPVAEALATAFWPGALTLVLPSRGDLPAELGGGRTIGVRVPDHSELRSFIESCGGAIASTSANLSGESDALNAQQAAACLGDGVQLIIDGGDTPGGVSSTVVDCTVDPPRVLREGPLVPASVGAVIAAYMSS
ncbi:MAG: threonylcarbamoyl-AMP synthase [Chloroflexi bacterium]|nr:threonylcarbamoyl-AMP synthase [Chloroflexota bacterium]